MIRRRATGSLAICAGALFVLGCDYTVRFSGADGPADGASAGDASADGGGTDGACPCGCPCDPSDEPVCAADGRTYDSTCAAACANATVACAGACPCPGQPCGGFTGTPCPPGLECVDDADGCDPTAGGVDCPGTCARP
jgi:hypothetical protein